MKYRDEAARRRHRNERIFAAALVVVLAVGLVAFLAWNRREEEKFQRERTYIPKRGVVTPEIELLQEYLRIDTSNPPGLEAAGAQWLAALLRRKGIEAQTIESAPGRLNVYARIRGRRQGEGLLLLHHIDVVPPGPDPWKRPPFGADVHMNELFARGAVDMKGIGMTHVLAFLDVARSGRQPERDVALLAVSDEETGSENGMKRLVEQHPELFEGIRYAIGEGGVIEVLREEVSYFGIEIGNLQFVEGTVTAPSIDSIRAARFAIEPWNARRRPDRILPEVRRFFADIAPTRLSFRNDLAHIDRTVSNGLFWRLPLPYRLLTQNVVWLEGDRREGNRAEARFVMLLLPDESRERWTSWLESRIAPAGAHVTETISPEPTTPFSRIDTPLFTLISAEARKQYGGRSGTMILHRQRNDSRFLRRIGITAYGVQPFPVDAYQSEAMHHADERVRLDWFMEGVALMRRVVSRWAFATDI